MPVIHLNTHINAPIQLCFDLERSIDFHLESTKQTGEQAIAGRKAGLIELNDTVTWRAKHLGIWQTFTSKITAMNTPYLFVDEMVQGAFQSFRHEHHFVEKDGGTLMTDIMTFSSPMGIAGELFNKLFLTKYLTDFLKERNALVKEYAESGRGEAFLKSKT